MVFCPLSKKQKIMAFYPYILIMVLSRMFYLWLSRNVKMQDYKDKYCTCLIIENIFKDCVCSKINSLLRIENVYGKYANI